ncbi:MAG TPA: dihydrodipicolinate synthase family protein [Acidimicrobiales bacterium]|jgi:4-hydroxy-tetrahydrodipicolinate synthase|nr:dihydrodipicolinate synthase family protein [Acidimicrobiales bacterium]
MARNRSTFVISMTPFDQQERFDEGAFRGHLQRLAASGIGAYVGGAGSGEGYTLSADERRRVLEIAVEELKGKVPVRAMGVEPRTADEMIAFANVVEDVGVDAMQVYSLDVGHAGHAFPDEIERYLNDVLSAIEVPAVLSTHFSVGYFVPIPVLVSACERYPHVIGINVTNPDVVYLAQLLKVLDERIEVHTGLMTQALAALSLGASGYLSTEGNVVPRLCVEVIDRYRAEDFAGTMAAYGRLLRVSAELFSFGAGMRTTKAALELLGLPGGIPRRPRLPLADGAVRAKIAQALDELGIRESERIE